MTSQSMHAPPSRGTLARFIFLSRWLQAPLYFGLILAQVNAGILKVKLATALIGISSIHLLKTFINAGSINAGDTQVLWQVVIHVTFVASAIALAWIDRLTYRPDDAH